MTTQYLQLNRAAEVAVITLKKPERLNAWTTEDRDELKALLVQLNEETETKAIVVTGHGDRAFCSGQDLNEDLSFGKDKPNFIHGFKNFFDVIRKSEKPTVAAVNGIAAGSGFQATLMMDFRIGHEGTLMGQPEINNGIPSIAGPWGMMLDRIGLSCTLDMTLTGRLVGAAEAFRIGLLNEIVKRDEVLPRSIALARDLAAKPPFAMRMTKLAYVMATQEIFDKGFELASELHQKAYASGEPQKHIGEFLRARADRKRPKS
jgi:enoyl-CoA hydratase/carnithine racemase